MYNMSKKLLMPEIIVKVSMFETFSREVKVKCEYNFAETELVAQKS